MAISARLTSELNRYVFTDTQVHKRSNYWYRGGQLKQLQDCCERHNIRTITPEIILREITTQIQKQSDTSIANLKSAIRDNEWIGDVIGVKKEEIREIEAMAQSKCQDDLKLFLEKSQNLLLKNNDASVDSALDAYFTGTAPFKSLKNRDDIPDALAFFALKNYCEKSRIKISVITGDKALSNAFSEHPDLFSIFPDINQFLKNTSLISDTETAAYQSLTEDHYDLFSDIVFNEIDSIRIEVSHRGYDVENSEISEIELTSCDVVNVYHDGFSASFSAEVKATANVTWFDHDHDDQGPSHKCYGFITEEHTISGYLRITLTPDSKDPFEATIDSMDSSITLEGEAQQDQYDND